MPRPCAEHYDALLGPAYLWAAGGIEAALAQGIADLAPWLQGRGLAVDLGAGFGMHTLPLARAGWEVVAVEASEPLFAQLARFCAGLPVRPVRGDLLDFPRLLQGRQADLVLCMGDTLTHLAQPGQVEALLRRVAGSLAPGGSFVATFRDYGEPPMGSARFIPVRADDRRILTCFIETEARHVVVHDLLHERGEQGWVTRVGAYRKRRLAPSAVGDALAAEGLAVDIGAGPRGMVSVRATR